VARGLTNKAIARELGLSPGTVKVHVERLLAKLGVTDRTQAAVMATASERSNAVP
jgi:DNA-binding NarL/FixJ family response regulator